MRTQCNVIGSCICVCFIHNVCGDSFFVFLVLCTLARGLRIYALFIIYVRAQVNDSIFVQLAREGLELFFFLCFYVEGWRVYLI